MITASVRSPNPIDNKAAAISNKVMGLLNWARNNRMVDECELPFSVLGP